MAGLCVKASHTNITKQCDICLTIKFLFTLVELFVILRKKNLCNNILVSLILGCLFISVGSLYGIYELGLLIMFDGVLYESISFLKGGHFYRS